MTLSQVTDHTKSSSQRDPQWDKDEMYEGGPTSIGALIEWLRERDNNAQFQRPTGGRRRDDILNDAVAYLEENGPRKRDKEKVSTKVCLTTSDLTTRFVP